MVVGEVVNVSGDAFGAVVTEIGRIGLVLQALGIVVVLWLIFQVIALIVNRKRRKALYRIEEKLVSLEEKVDRVLEKKK